MEYSQDQLPFLDSLIIKEAQLFKQASTTNQKIPNSTSSPTPMAQNILRQISPSI